MTFRNETEFCDAVIDLALLEGLLVHHCRPARTAKGWATPIQGSKGFPDLAITGRRGFLLRELKADKGRVRPEQDDWLDRLTSADVDAAVWRPTDWPDTIHAQLKEIR